ncbi:MAG: hypothetical protein MZV65_52410 [Chromatiales bacterium]|nr:hypothetical protein [Chromatiales bacterium]
MLNIIPNQQAGTIVRNAGLATDPSGRWAPVDVLSYASHGVIPTSTSSATRRRATSRSPATWPARRPRSAPMPCCARSRAVRRIRHRPPTRPATARSR